MPGLNSLEQGRNYFRSSEIGRYVDGIADRFWVYQDGLNPVAQFDGAGAFQMVFVYGLRANVPELIVMQSGQVLRVISDQVGSVRRIVDVSDGTVWQDTRYSPFGVIETETLRAGFDQPFRFAGGIWDVDTRLIRFGARDYDVMTGRWTAKDPIRFDGGVNLYEYANGAPQMYVDPTGLAWYHIENDTLDTISNFSAGFGDALLLGLGGPLRDLLGIDGVDQCTTAYSAGGWASFLIGFARLLRGSC